MVTGLLNVVVVVFWSPMFTVPVLTVRLPVRVVALAPRRDSGPLPDLVIAVDDDRVVIPRECVRVEICLRAGVATPAVNVRLPVPAPVIKLPALPILPIVGLADVR